MSAINKMKIEIWSDVVCPFCYIGKRRFENALAQFAHSGDVEVEWKSFQLSPYAQTDVNTNIHRYLAEHKGISLEQATELNNYVTEMAGNVGLEYHFDKAVVANTFKAHQLIHLAKAHKKQGEAKEALLKAYFTEGKNIDDIAALTDIAQGIGLDADKIRDGLENSACADDVNMDIHEARRLGIRGVPFFVFDRKYGISGAQESGVFLQTLKKSFAEWRENNPEPGLEVIGGQSCSPDGECDEV